MEETTTRTTSCFLLLAAAHLLSAFSANGWGAEPSAPMKAGVIGMDAHALPWTRIINNPQASGELADMTVVAGFPGGSPDIPQSVELREKSMGPVAELGVEIVESIDDLLEKVDVVLILSIDGRTHLEQARPVFAAGKPLFIDKPIAASLAEAIGIFRLAKKQNVPCFTSSPLRYAERTLNIRQDPGLGKLVGCDQYAPCTLEPHHPDFFWYGIHGVEPLFTIMGPGCLSVTRVRTEGTDLAVGVWSDGRIGTFRGIRQGLRGYGSTVFGSKGIVPGGGFDGYEPLLVEIVKFFKTGKPPFSADETLEIFAFMEKSFAPDAPGLRRLMRAGEEAEKKNLKIAAGLQCRHSVNRQELIKRIRDGELGDLQLIRAYRIHKVGGMGAKPEGYDELVWQIKNFIRFFWVSGGLFAEMNIHQIDEICWLKGDWPATAHGIGDRAAVHSGKVITWDEMFNSKFQFVENIDAMDYETEPPVKPGPDGYYPVPIPGHRSET